MSRKNLLAFLFIFALNPLRAQAPVDEALAKMEEGQWWREAAWEKLLHYHRDIFFLKKSSISDPVFYLSPHGNKNPKAELSALIKEFFNEDAAADETMDCRFPARAAFVRERMPESLLPPTGECPRLTSWLEKLNPEGVSLVFSSYYFNNPASMYGHTFLKLKRKGVAQKGGLLDYTVNYAAVTNSKNGLMFAVRGLMGGYEGAFSTEPFYVKIQQYNNLESRDIWEYDLALSFEAVNRLVLHLWELGPVRAPYFFFNKNCSYQLLPLLEAAEPTLDLASRFRFRAIPLDTLSAVLSVPGLKKETIHHPSHLKSMLARRSRLTPQEIDLAEGWVETSLEKEPPTLDALPQRGKARVLTSAHDLFRYQHGFYRDQSPEVKKIGDRILLALKDIPREETEEGEISIPEIPPENGHPTGMASISFGADKENAFEEFTIRSALHDLSANPRGFIAGSELEMIKFRIRHDNQRGQTYLEEFTPINIMSLTPYDRWVHPPSWSVGASVEPARDLPGDPENNYQGVLRGGSGYAFRVSGFQEGLVYGMWMAEAGGGSAFRDGYRAGAGGQGGVVVSLLSWLRFDAWASALRFPAGQPDNRVWMKTTLAMDVTRTVEARFIWERNEGHQEARAEAILYW